MNAEQIANELRGMPDSALQQQATQPSVPGYLVADEIQRRVQARNAPQGQGNQQNQPTLLAQMAKNLAPPAQPMVNNQAPQQPPPVPASMLAGNPTQPQRFDYGGYVPRETYAEGDYVPDDNDSFVSPDDGSSGGPANVSAAPPRKFDPSTLYSDVPVGAGSGDLAAPSTSDLATMDAPPPMPARPDSLDVWSKPTAIPQTKKSPLQAGDDFLFPTKPSAGDDFLFTKPPATPTPPAARDAVPVTAPAAASALGTITGETPVTAIPQTSTSPLQNPQNTHQGGSKFFQIMNALAPTLTYLGNVGAGMSQMGGNLGTGVGFANQMKMKADEAQAQRDYQNQELAMRKEDLAQRTQQFNQQFGLQQQDALGRALQSGAQIVGPNGMTQNAPVLTPPPAMVNGVPMGAPQTPIAGSGQVPFSRTATAPLAGQTIDWTGAMPEAVEQRAAALDIAKFNAQQDAVMKAKQAEDDQKTAKLRGLLDQADPNHTANSLAVAQFLAGDTHALDPIKVAATDSLYDPIHNKWLTTGQQKPETQEQNKLAYQKALSRMVQAHEIAPADLNSMPKLTAALANSKILTSVEAGDAAAYLAANPTPTGTINRFEIGQAAQQGRLQTVATQKAYNSESAAMDKIFQPLVTQSNNLELANTLINTPGSVSSALGQMKGIMAAAGGQGVRLTNVELQSVKDHAGIKSNIETWFNSIGGDGMSSEQRTQWNNLLGGLRAAIAQKQQRLVDYKNSLLDMDNPTPKDFERAHNNFMQSEILKQNEAGIARPKTKPERDALLPGTPYIGPDGVPSTR